jgi:hypothetical protein
LVSCARVHIRLDGDTKARFRVALPFLFDSILNARGSSTASLLVVLVGVVRGPCLRAVSSQQAVTTDA